MGHGAQIGGDDASIDIFAHGQGELRFGAEKLLRLDHLAQPDGLPLVIGNLDAHSRFSRHALNQNALRAHRQAQVVGEAGDAAVLHSRFRLELVGGDNRPRIDLRDVSGYIELGTLSRQHGRRHFEFVFIDCLLSLGAVQQGARRQFVNPSRLRHDRLGLVGAIGAGVDGRFAITHVSNGTATRGQAGCRFHDSGILFLFV